VFFNVPNIQKNELTFRNGETRTLGFQDFKMSNKKKKKPHQSDASSIQYEMMRLDDLGTQDVAVSNLKNLADEFRGTNLGVWISSANACRSQLKRPSGKVCLIEILVYLMESYGPKMASRVRNVVRCLFGFVDDEPDSKVSKAVAEAFRNCVSLVVLNIVPDSEKQRRSIDKAHEKDESPFLKLILKPLFSRLGVRSSLNERLCAASCLRSITTPLEPPHDDNENEGTASGRTYTDLLEENVSRMARVLNKVLWSERSRAGANLCASVGNLTNHLSSDSMRPFRKRFSDTIMHRLGDKDGSWQTAQEAVKTLGKLVLSENGPRLQWFQQVKRRLEDISKSHKTQKVRVAAQEAFEMVNKRVAEVIVESSKDDDVDDDDDDVVVDDDNNDLKDEEKSSLEDEDQKPSREDIKSKLQKLRELRKDVRKNIVSSSLGMHSNIVKPKEERLNVKVAAVGTGRNAATALQQVSRDLEHPSNVPTPRRSDRQALLNKNQLTTQSTFTRIEDLMIRQEQMWSELISLQRLVYDPPWLPSLETRLEKLETQMEEAIMRIDAVERRQREIDRDSKQQNRLTNWTVKTASSIMESSIINDIPQQGTIGTKKKKKKKKQKQKKRRVNEALSKEILNSEGESRMLNILNRKSSTTLSELTPKACAAVLSCCADLISRNKFLDITIPWIEEAISHQLIPPLLQIPLRERIVDALYKLSSSPTNYGVKAAELYQKSSRLGWVS